MCLAKAFVVSAEDGAENAPILENVTRAVVEDGVVRLTTLFGQVEEVAGCIESIDFNEGRLILRSDAGVAPRPGDAG